METTNTIVPPTPSPEPSISELRALLSEAPAAAQAEATPETPVTPPAEKTAEASEQTPAESETAKPQETDKPKEESALDKRFSKLTRQRDEARQRDIEAQAELARLRRELEAKSTPPGPVEAAAAAAEPAAKPAGRPAPPDIANWTGTWEELEQAKLEYSERLTDWKLEQAHQAGATEAKRSQQLESQKAINAKWEATAAASTHPDFQDAIASVGPFITEAGVADLIKGSDVGGEILMYMHEHQDETLAMARLGNPVAIAREIGKLEARLTPPKTKPAAAAQPLPKPPAAIDSATAPVTVDLDKADMTTFKRAMGKILAG